MFSEELKIILFQVIMSWQVIAVSIALVLYISLVNYAARAHHKPVSVSKTKPKKKEKINKEKAKPAAKETEATEINEQE
jgi:ATP/ADP translocase